MHSQDKQIYDKSSPKMTLRTYGKDTCGYLSFGNKGDTVHPIGYQRMVAANPLVGGVAQQARQALALPIPVG